MTQQSISSWIGALVCLLLTLFFGNEALLRFQQGTDFFGLIISLFLTLVFTIATGKFIKELI